MARSPARLSRRGASAELGPAHGRCEHGRIGWIASNNGDGILAPALGASPLGLEVFQREISRDGLAWIAYQVGRMFAALGTIRDPS